MNADWYQNEHTLLETVGTAFAAAPAPPQVPGYDDLHELGRGGQGIVYRAMQRSTKRAVAIKLLLDGALASDTTRLRFEREIDLVAALQHPHIVRVYDRGVTEAGHPYYVMEYIEGDALDRLIRSAATSQSSRMRSARRRMPVQTPRAGESPPLSPALTDTLILFEKICEAVNYAHQRGVIHRDLKPSNIRIDRAGEPHVLDFGLAKSALHSFTGASQRSMSMSGQFVGSLPWASPEQAEGIPSQIDVRTDVYSLGVLLYQLLTGRFPYEVDGSFSQVITNIRTTPPARPSSVRPWIDDELETIVLKALAKEPERRYQTAGDLARELHHYLNHEPIEAKHDSAWYQVRTTLRRYRLFASIASAFVVLAAGVAVTTSVLYRRALVAEVTAEERRAQAEAEADKARRTKKFLEGMFGSLDPAKSKGRDAGLLRQLLDDAAQRVEGELSGQPEVEAPVRATIGRTYASLGDYASAEAQLKAACKLYQASRAPDDVESLQAMSDLAGVYQDQGRYTEAEPLARTALDGLRRVLGESDRETLTAMNNLAFLLHNLGQTQQAEALYRQTLERRRQTLGAEHLDTINSCSNLAALLLEEGKLEDAAPLIQQTLVVRQRLLGPDHPDTITSLNNAARLAQEQGRLDEAETLYRQSLEGYRRVLGEDHPRTLTAMSNLAVVCQQRARPAEAEQLLRQAVDLQRRSLPDDDPAAAPLLNNLARVLQEEGNAAQAEPLLRSVWKALQQAYGEEHPQTLKALNNLAGVLSDLGRREEALELFHRGAEIRRRTLAPDHPERLLAEINLGAALRDCSRLDEALSVFGQALQGAAGLPPEHWLLPYLKGGYGETLLLLNRFAEAETPLRESYDAFQTMFGAQHPKLRKASERLYRLYTAWGKPEQARAYAPDNPK